MKRITKWLAVGMTAASVALCYNARAGTAVFDFETNPTNQGITFFGNGEWLTSGGNPGGYLKVTHAQEGDRASMIFPDLDGGLVVKAFTFEVDVRIGGGTTPPADGFSVNYAREGDPVLDDGVGFAASPTGEGDLPEEGTQTGLAIGFDEWFSGGTDAVGFSVRVDNEIILELPRPTINGTLEDPTSLQTGPTNPDRVDTDITTSWALLGWARLKIDIDQNGVLNLTWKGTKVIDNLQTDFFPSPGRIVFGGRVGGSNANHHVDNITLTTVGAESYLVTGLKARPDGFRLKVNDGAAAINTATIVLSVNDEVVPPSTYTINKTGATTFITYSKFPETFPVGETVSVAMTASDTSGTEATETRTYVTPSYAVVTPADAVPAGSVNQTVSGFGGYAHQLPIGRFPGNANNYWNAERQINNGYIDPATDQPYENRVDTNDRDGLLEGDPFYTEDLSINYSRMNPDTLNIEPNGNFRENATVPAYQVPDGVPPGLPGLNADGTVGTSSDNAAYELLAYVDLPAGVYQFGVNSDDGFRVTAGLDARSIFAEEAGLWNDGRGASDTLFWVVAETSGFYPLRLLWWNGTGGANVEFFQVMEDDSKQLVYGDFGDPNDAVTPYPSSSVKFNAAVVNTIPWEGQTGVLPNAPIKVMLKDGSAVVNQSSIKIALNGTDLGTPTFRKIGDVTHATVELAELLVSSSTNTVTLEWAPTGGDTQTETWQFVATAYSPLPEWIARPVGSGTNPGMIANVNQMDVLAGWNGTQNRWHAADQQSMGLFLPSVATLTGPQNIDVVNMNADGTDGAPSATVGIFPNDSAIPGVPGNVTKADKTDNIAMNVVTYLEFPTAGYYTMGVNSDDGFRVVARESLPRTALMIESPASIAGAIGAISGGPEAGAGGPALPRGTPLTGTVVMVDPPLADAPLNNAAALAGNIALIDRGVNTYEQKILRAQNAGATGVIIVNKATPEQGPLPVVMGGLTGAVTIPSVMIMDADGETIKAQLASGVTASIGLDGLMTLGQFNDGRGQNGVGTRFGFYVPKPGVYPFRLTWFEGGGGANVEWFSVDANNTAILLNDPTNAASIKAFRNAPAVEEPLDIAFMPPVTNPDGTITISWAGAGTLQETTVIPAEWTNSADQSNPQILTPGSAVGGKYYRVMGQ